MVTDGLIFWLDVDEVSGTRFDAHSLGNDFDSVNGVSFGTGKTGNAASFASASLQCLEIPLANQTSMDYSLSADFTVAMWIKPTTITTSWMYLYDNMVSNKGSGAIINNTKIALYVPKVSIHTNLQLTISGGFSAGNWYHVVLQFDGSAAKARFVINNVATAWTGATFSPPFPSAPYDPAATFRLGSSVAGGSYFNGLMDTPAMWGRTLSDAEISELYNSGNGASYTDIFGGGGVPATPKNPLFFGGGL